MFRRCMLVIGACALSGAASALYVPDQDIEIERTGAASFKITGTNSWGEVDVRIEDKHLFRGFKVEGENGDHKVDMEIKSAGLGAGWRIEGKIGAMKVDVRVRQDGAFSKTWTVRGKVDDRKIEKKVEDEWEIDPAAWAVLVIFDCCEDDAPKPAPEPKPEPEPAPEPSSERAGA